MIIREMVKEDLPQVLAIENGSFVSCWTEKQFLYELEENQFSYLFVAEQDGYVIGFIDFWITFDSGCINQIAVAGPLNHKGIGTILLNDAIDRMKLAGVRMITLEVRTQNTKAYQLYLKNGFQTMLTKEHYYDNGDDAYYMIKECVTHE